MANTIQILRSSTHSATTAPSSLENGEFALVQGDKKLYIGRQYAAGDNVEVWHIPTLMDVSGGNGITSTIDNAASTNNAHTLAVDVTDSNIFADSTNKGIASFSTDNFLVSSGVVTIKDNGIALTTETTGDYVEGVSGGTGVTVTNSGGEGSTPTVAIGQAVSTTSNVQFGNIDSSGNMTIEGNITGDHGSNNLTVSSTNANTLIEGTTFAGNDVTIGSGGNLTLAQDPSQSLHSATKAYVDAVKTGLDYKDSARLATTENITLSGTQTIDGVSAAADDRVLVKDQSTGSQNGIYLCKSGAWARAADFDADAEVTSGAFVFIEEGTTNGSEGWILTTTGSITVGTTAQAWSQFSAAGMVTAGAGLTKTGHVVDVVGTSNRISVAADSIDISSSYVGQNTITTLGTVATGTWNATKIGVAKGGTNLSSYTAGDIVYASAGTTIAKLGIGANGKILQSNGSAPVWADIDGGTF